MSKTGRGILRDPGPYFCLYSPECVEVEFCEVRIDGVQRSSRHQARISSSRTMRGDLRWGTLTSVSRQQR
jgi:hypothetical protein